MIIRVSIHDEANKAPTRQKWEAFLVLFEQTIMNSWFVEPWTASRQ